MGSDERLVLVIFLASIMILAPITGVVGAAGGASTANIQEGSSGGDFVDIHDDVSIWKGAAIPLRTETGVENAVTVGDIPGLTVETTTEGDTQLNRDAISVYETGSPVPLSYKTSDLDTSQFGSDVQILVGHLEENTTEDDVNMSDLPMTGDELLNELTQDNLDTLNANVSFELREASLDSNGELEGYDEIEPSEAGFYTVMMVDGTDSLVVENGDIKSIDDARVIGVEQFAVHDAPSKVSVDASEPGEDVVFNVSATELDGDVNHAIVLYDAQAFAESRLTFSVTEELATDLSTEDITIKHEVKDVNGVQSLGEDVKFFGESLDARSVGGMTNLADIISFFANEGDFDEPETEVIDDMITLNASSTANVSDADTELVVETYGNWSEGDYRWIHVAMGDSTDQFQANTDTVTLEPSGGAPAPAPGPGPAPIPDPGPNPEPTAVISIDPNPAQVGEEVTFSGADSYDDERDIISYEWTIDGETFSGETVTTSFDAAGEYDVELTVTNDFAEENTTTATATVEADRDDGTGSTGGTDGTGNDDESFWADGIDGDDGDDDDDGLLPVPGFGVIASIVALLSVALLALRQQH
ncbi:PKD domain-containing protein [Halosolutus gelatinilyticus]|uniref:PKD domain-containing protein n=1 Tax=Halosolutus gelatinilyticus TaxID=2931975 RepID=UPI001FF6E7CB|nr:PKD domain-containing protein [Halosolutus gelatinilyticus]